MPGALAVTRAVNEAIAGSPAAVQEAIAGHTRVRAALDASAILDGLDAEFAAEARAVLDALPPEVDRVILDAIGDALDAGVPVEVEWEETAREGGISVRVSTEDGGLVRITLVTPDGRTFTA
jgi:hypothetical protein